MRKDTMGISNGVRKFWLICSILIISFCGFYFFQVNAMADHQTRIKEEGRRLDELMLENENLQIEFTKNSSLENLEILVQNLDFEKVTEVSHLKALETWVAVK